MKLELKSHDEILDYHGKEVAVLYNGIYYQVIVSVVDTPDEGKIIFFVSDESTLDGTDVEERGGDKFCKKYSWYFSGSINPYKAGEERESITKVITERKEGIIYTYNLANNSYES